MGCKLYLEAIQQLSLSTIKGNEWNEMCLIVNSWLLSHSLSIDSPNQGLNLVTFCFLWYL